MSNFRNENEWSIKCKKHLNHTSIWWGEREHFSGEWKIAVGPKWIQTVHFEHWWLLTVTMLHSESDSILLLSERLYVHSETPKWNLFFSFFLSQFVQFHVNGKKIDYIIMYHWILSLTHRLFIFHIEWNGGRAHRQQTIPKKLFIYA